nr:MAG TPA: hypothetical protein [Caudoviricetes sp.]
MGMMNSKNFVRVVAFAARYNHAWADALVHADPRLIEDDGHKFFVSSMNSLLSGEITWDQLSAKKLLEVVNTSEKQKKLLDLADHLLKKEDREIIGLQAAHEFCDYMDHPEDDHLHYDHVSTTSRFEVCVHDNTIEISINRPDEWNLFSVNMVDKDDSLIVSPFYRGDDVHALSCIYPTELNDDLYSKFNAINMIRLRHLLSMDKIIERLMLFKRDTCDTHPDFRRRLYKTGSLFINESFVETNMNYCGNVVQLKENGITNNPIRVIVDKLFDDTNATKDYSVENCAIEVEYRSNEWTRYFVDFDIAKKVFKFPMDGIADINKKMLLVFHLVPSSQHKPYYCTRDIECYMLYGVSKDELIEAYNDQYDAHKNETMCATDLLLNAVTEVVDHKKELGAFYHNPTLTVRYDNPKQSIKVFEDHFEGGM